MPIIMEQIKIPKNLGICRKRGKIYKISKIPKMYLRKTTRNLEIYIIITYIYNTLNNNNPYVSLGTPLNNQKLTTKV